MDIHHKITAVLHIVAGALSLFGIAVLALLVGVFSSAMHLDPMVMNIIAVFGVAIAVFFALLALGELIAGIYLLKGSAGARPWIIVFSVLQLINVPLGTALGAYSLWALLRPRPAN